MFRKLLPYPNRRRTVLLMRYIFQAIPDVRPIRTTRRAAQIREGVMLARQLRISPVTDPGSWVAGTTLRVLAQRPSFIHALKRANWRHQALFGAIGSGWLPVIAAQYLAQTFNADGTVLESCPIGNGQSHVFHQSMGMTSWGIADLCGRVIALSESRYLLSALDTFTIKIPQSGPFTITP